VQLNLRNERKAVGTKQVKRAILSDQVQKIYIAKDADAQIVSELIELCQQRSIEVVLVDTMIDLGKACGIDVSAASAAILK